MNVIYCTHILIFFRIISLLLCIIQLLLPYQNKPFYLRFIILYYARWQHKNRKKHNIRLHYSKIKLYYVIRFSVQTHSWLMFNSL